MFAVIFEVQPLAERWDDYLGIAKLLRPELKAIDGFIENERFASKRAEGRLLSLSTWRDEKALIRWRTLGVHHAAQEKGRFEIFADYHLRVGEIVADTRLPEGETLRQQRFDQTEVGDAKVVTVTEVSPGASGVVAGSDLAAALGLPEIGTAGVLDREVFESITTESKLLLLAGWTDAEAAARWVSKSIGGNTRHRQIRIIRDYGMTDRREAPQYYPAVNLQRG
jgi:heme-degrading monooxygenase HmoA